MKPARGAARRVARRLAALAEEDVLKMGPASARALIRMIRAFEGRGHKRERRYARELEKALRERTRCTVCEGTGKDEEGSVAGSPSGLCRSCGGKGRNVAMCGRRTFDEWMACRGGEQLASQMSAALDAIMPCASNQRVAPPSIIHLPSKKTVMAREAFRNETMQTRLDDARQDDAFDHEIEARGSFSDAKGRPINRTVNKSRRF